MSHLLKVLPKEKPRKTRAKNMEKARLQLMKNYDQLLELVRKLEPEVNRDNAKVEATYLKKLEDSRKIAKKEGKILTWSQRYQIDEEHLTSKPDVYNKAYYTMLQKNLKGLGPCEPDIDSISTFSIRPGGYLGLWGSCFGPSQGKVWLQLSDQYCVELDVYQWYEMYICASLNPIIADVPLRPYYGSVWLVTGDGKISNVWPIMYEPIYSLWIATWTKDFNGGVWGYSTDETFLENRNLGDPDFTVEWVENNHSGSGWSTLTSPTARDQSFAQGYHIGCDAFRSGHMELLYRVNGPKGIPPPEISELGPWGYLGDYW